MREEVTTTITRELINSNGDTYGEATIDIVASYYAGCPAKGPTCDCGGTPEEYPEVDIISAFIHDEEVELTQEEEERVTQYFLENPPSIFDHCD